MNGLRLFLLAGLLAGLALLWVSWRTAVDHSSPIRFAVAPPPSDFPLALEQISFRTRDGLTLHGWYGQAPQEKGTVILLHPYRAGRTMMYSRAKWYARQGFSVFLYDARATGESEGNRISLGYHETDDLTAALVWVRNRSDAPIILHGVSQGGATILLAAERLGAVAAIVVESTYDTLLNAGDRRFRRAVGLPGWLAGVFYRPFVEMRMGLNARNVAPIETITSIDAPILIISGKEDQHTWASDTERLYAAAPDPKRLWLVPDAAHVDLHAFAPDSFEAELGAFLDAHNLR